MEVTLDRRLARRELPATAGPGPPGRARGHLRSGARTWASPAIVVTALVLGVACGIGGVVLARVYQDRYVMAPGQLAPVPSIAPASVILDWRPVPLTITANWLKIPVTVTRDAVRSDHTLWQKMNVDDWDALPDGLREEGLQAMFARHAHVLEPRAWRTMRPEAWDEVPQPMRGLAFMRMIGWWVDYYDAGGAHGIDRAEVAAKARAILVAESYFEHRAVNTNRDGTMDIGLAQASIYAREVVRRWHRLGLADFGPTDAELFDPLYGTRMLVFWFTLMLDEAEGDVALAVRAYNVGIAEARAGRGHDYLAEVVRRERTYVQHPGTCVTWRFLREQRGRTP